MLHVASDTPEVKFKEHLGAWRSALPAFGNDVEHIVSGNQGPLAC